ncbi:hypothetical protein [Desulfitobacterium metallireducens]|nr:hypothetical protein [Desulfitobacterium metallireducens]
MAFTKLAKMDVVRTLHEPAKRYTKPYAKTARPCADFLQKSIETSL